MGGTQRWISCRARLGHCNFPCCTKNDCASPLDISGPLQGHIVRCQGGWPTLPNHLPSQAGQLPPSIPGTPRDQRCSLCGAVAPLPHQLNPTTRRQTVPSPCAHVHRGGNPSLRPILVCSGLEKLSLLVCTGVVLLLRSTAHYYSSRCVATCCCPCARLAAAACLRSSKITPY